MSGHTGVTRVAGDAHGSEDISLPWLNEPKFKCFGCSPRNHIGLALRIRRVGPGVIRSEVTFDENYASYPGVVHGGIVGVLVDEVMGSVITLDRGLLAFSTTLRTKFLMPVRIGEPYTAEARITKESADVIKTEADVSSMDGEVHAVASATFQPIRSDQAKAVMGLDDDDYERLQHYFDHRIGEP